MAHPKAVAVCALVLLAQMSSAQTRVVSAPKEPSLLNLTGGWARASALGDLRDVRLGSDDVELRVWHGYGSSETQSIILRRANGHWSAFLARVIRCELSVARAVGDTASAATMRQLVAEARRHCGQSVADVAPGSRLITTDTVVVDHFAVPEAEIEAAWNDAQTAGVLQLPGRDERARAPDDGSTFFIEVRRGNTYRATEAADVEQPETKTDAQVKQIYAAVQRLRR